MSKIIRISVSTGFCGGVHEEEIEYTGQTEDEINDLAREYKQEVCDNYISWDWEIEDEDE